MGIPPGNVGIPWASRGVFRSISYTLIIVTSTSNFITRDARTVRNVWLKPCNLFRPLTLRSCAKRRSSGDRWEFSPLPFTPPLDFSDPLHVPVPHPCCDTCSIGTRYSKRLINSKNTSFLSLCISARRTTSACVSLTQNTCGKSSYSLFACINLLHKCSSSSG